MTAVELRAGSAIHPFWAEIREDALDDLRRRLAATRRPSRELVGDRSQGVQLATLQALCRYWAAEYEGRRVEARHVNEVDRGGHFAAWEEPELFATEMRAAFRPLRTPRIPEPRG